MFRRQIILATRSLARKKLLENVGLRVRVIPSGIRESKDLKSGPAVLVKANAAKKALEVSRRLESGIIIAADTLSIAENKVFGKPRDYPQAVKWLRKLSKKAHYVYTGLAVLKKTKGACKLILDYEKTRVWMRKMSADEIKKYLKSSGSIDKAGSFDIQGKGAFFIERIDGCFYNVVGLPIAKLYRAFKKLNISIFVLFFVSSIGLFGCATEYNIATKQEDIILYDTEKEVKIGRQASMQIEKQYKTISDPVMLARLNSIGQRIVAVCDRKNLTYRFAILDQKEINAVSLPGGYIYVYKGLLDFVKNDDELAGVLAHEVGHIVAKHSIKRLQAAMGLNILTVLAAASGNTDAAAGTDLAGFSMMMSYSREDELLSDKLAVRYMRKAGFKPSAITSFLDRLKQKSLNEPLRPGGFYARTHPYISERISIIKQELGEQLNFKDYINRTESSW